MQKVLLLDNYDSFTWNLAQILTESGLCEFDVIKNDQITIKGAQVYDKILLSPGPGLPDDAGILKPLIKELGPTKSILGVCLGHQAIAEVYGIKLKQLKEISHGESTTVSIIEEHHDYLFDGLPKKFQAGRYHSWIVDLCSFNNELKVTALNENYRIMAISHREYDVKGVQFHPESILTPLGSKIIENWLRH
ncbi:MAG: aminodeoxychorismate/anthranilate synthase component II [Bacteroidetes bacterium]|nr:aminodeoxychorismate/anthranilate synthase component II [Bacteroidota bacterium]